MPLAFVVIHTPNMATLCTRSNSSDYEEVIERKVKKDRNEIVLAQLCNKVHQSKKRQVELEKLMTALERKLRTIRELLFILPTNPEQMGKLLIEVKFCQVDLRDMLLKTLAEPKKEEKISDPPDLETCGLCEVIEAGRPELSTGWRWQFVHWRPISIYGITVKDIIVHRVSKYYYETEEAALHDAQVKCSDFIKFDFVHFELFEVV